MAQAMSKEEIRQAAEDDIRVFARLVQPTRVYGEIHDTTYSWLTRPDASDSQLVLLPRAHQKSHVIAVWVAWHITKNPWTTVLYVSATEDLAISQLYAIKSILESDVYRRYWPEMINDDEAKREEWSARNIKVDHPLRKKHGVRDRTVAARSIGGNTTGLHSDVVVFDDIVIPSNAYTIAGREQVAASYSQFSSVLNPGGMTKAVGTRYHPADIYEDMINSRVEEFNEDGEIVGEYPMFEHMMKPVIDDDGKFLWPREQDPQTGMWYGFNNQVLAKIRGKYLSVGERVQYYAQYYNEPNDPESERVDTTRFQYYDQKYLTYDEGVWAFKGKPLSIFCAGDLAYTTGERSDYTAFAVVGLDSDGMIYILELDNFRTNKYDVYYERFEQLLRKWHFKKARIETNAGANVIVEYIKDELRKEGLACAIEGKNARGEKNERIAAVLEPRYSSQTIWHYRGGYMSVYEEQLTLARPAHDDLKDAVSAAIEISKPPGNRGRQTKRGNKIVTHPRFGGRIRG